MRLAKSEVAPSSTASWLDGVGELKTNPVGGDLPATQFLSAFYGLNNVETRLMVQWLLAGMLEEPDRQDLRYALRSILHSPALQSRFDIVLIDCPPRLSTATINALCASTHLLIPSVADRASLEATENSLTMFRSVTARLNKDIELLGVVPTMTTQTKLTDDETNELNRFRLRVHHNGGLAEPYIFTSNIPRKTQIAQLAGTGIALLRAPARTRMMFRLFCAEVEQRLWPYEVGASTAPRPRMTGLVK
jgi:chromosome partitioning protein